MVKILTSPVQGDVPFGGHKATGLADPTAAQDAATKAYVDVVAQGLAVKASAADLQAALDRITALEARVGTFSSGAPYPDISVFPSASLYPLGV